MRLRLAAALLAAAPLAAAPAHAQRGRAPALPVELGVDGAFAYDERTDGTQLELPLAQVRAGFFLTPRLSLEPALGVQRLGNDAATITNTDASFSLLAHLTGRPVGRARTASLFVRPFVGLSRASLRADGPDINGDRLSQSVTQANVGVGLGVKLPVLDRLAWRLEGAYTYRPETDDAGATNRFALNVGLSFLTR